MNEKIFSIWLNQSEQKQLKKLQERARQEGYKSTGKFLKKKLFN
jgi:hypothetical protein